MLTLCDRTEGMLLGTAVYDALGIPTETLSEEEIRARYKLPIEDDLPCREDHPFFDAQKAFPGRWSDDTQLMLATAFSIANEGTINMRDIAREHVRTMDKDGTMGWGKSTRNSVERLRENGLNVVTSGELNGNGNGVLMKMGPLAVALHYHPDFSGETEKLDVIESFTYMTHRSAIALLTAAVHEHMLENLADRNSEDLFTAEARRAWLQKAYDTALRFEATLEYRQSELLSTQFRQLLENFAFLETNAILRDISSGGTCYAPDSLTMTYGLFADDPTFSGARRGVEIGGDTDSNAAMVGGMVGLFRGPSEIPKHLLEKLWRRNEVSGIAEHFASTIAACV